MRPKQPTGLRWKLPCTMLAGLATAFALCATTPPSQAEGDGTATMGNGLVAPATSKPPSPAIVAPMCTVKRPDFVVMSIAAPPTNLAAGAVFSTTVTVKNTGTLVGTADVLRVWRNKPVAAAVGEAGDAQRTVGSLAAGATVAVEFTGLAAPGTNGTFTFRAFVDANNTAVELCETNNQRTVTYAVPPVPPTAVHAVVTTVADPACGGKVCGGGTYVVGNNAVLTATASNRWRFIAWNDGVTANPRTIVVPAGGITCTACFARISTVIVRASPTTGGSVSGTGTYLVGSNILLTASASNNWRFMRWNDGATNNPCAMTVPASDVTYTAYFSAVATIQVSTNPAEGGTVTGGGVYFVGSHVVLTATASAGWRFLSWSDGSKSNPRTVSVKTGGASYTATFAQTAVVTAVADPACGGKVCGGGTYVVGSNAVLTATASNLWRFTAWNDGVTTNRRTVVVPAGGVTYTACFARISKVTVLAYPTQGGSVSGAGTYLVGSHILLTASASNDWRFIRWNDGETNNPYAITVPANNVTYTAYFSAAATIRVSTNPVMGGTVTGGGVYAVGSHAVLTATPADDWEFLGWSDGPTANPRTVEVGAGGATYTANFSPLGAVAVLANPPEGGSVAGGGQYLVGSNVAVTATAATNWVFMDWNDSVTNNPWVFAAVSGTTVCTANFARIATVSVLAVPASGGSVSGAGTYVVGSDVLLTAVAAGNWRFTAWNDGATNNPYRITVPPTNITCTAHFTTENPDFIITSLTTTPSTPTKGGAFTATVTVKNQGTVADNAGVLRLWLNHFTDAAPGEAGDAQQVIGTLAGGASQSVTFSGLTAPNTNGTFTLRAFVDADNATVEQSEGNNQKTFTYTFAPGPPGQVDFVVSAIDFVNKPTLTGEVFSILVTVTNQGNTAADAGLLSVYLSKPSAALPGEAGDASMAVGTLAPGASLVVAFNDLRADAVSGTHTLRAFVNSQQTTTETSYGNNQKTATYALNATSLQIVPAGDGVDLVWRSYWGQSYALYRCTNLTVGFVIFTNNIKATPPTNTVHDASPPTPSYYRLDVLP